MVRKGVVILGIGLALLSALGLAADRHAHLLWFNVLAAILSIGGVGLIDQRDLGEAAAAARVGDVLRCAVAVLVAGPVDGADLVRAGRDRGREQAGLVMADQEARRARPGDQAGHQLRPTRRPVVRTIQVVSQVGSGGV